MRTSLVALLLVAATSAAAASPPASPAPSPARPAPGWYGWQIAGFDVLGAGLVALGVHVARDAEDCECEEFGSGYLMLFGGASYLAGGPTMHYRHRRPGVMVLSGALRFGLPIAAGLIADERGAARGEMWTAVIGGAGVAMVLDWALLSHDRHRLSPATEATVAPFVAPSLGGSAGATAGLTGRF